MAIRPEPTFAQGPFNLNPAGPTVQIRWYRYITELASASYGFELFDYPLASPPPAPWSAPVGTGSAVIAAPPGGETWSENDKVLLMSAATGQTVELAADARLLTGVAGTRHAFEFVVDTRDIQDAQFEARLTVTNDTFRLMIEGTKMYIWSDALSSPPGYIGWDLVYDDTEVPPLGRAVYKFRFTIISISTESSICMGYWTKFNFVTNEWDPLVIMSFGGGSKIPSSCDYPWNPALPLPNMGTLSLSLRNGGLVASEVRVDHLKLFSWNSTTQLPPWDGVLGEPTFDHYEVHGSLTNDFVPDFAGGTTLLLSLPQYQWAPTFNVTVPGLQKGKINYLKVLCVKEQPGSPGAYYWSESNQITVRVPEQKFAPLFAAIRGVRRKVSNLMARAATPDSRFSFLFAKWVEGRKRFDFLFVSARGVGQRFSPLFVAARGVRTKFSFLFVEAVRGRMKPIFLFVLPMGIRKSPLFARIVKEGKKSVYMLTRVAKFRKRYCYLLAITAEDPVFTNKKHEKYRKLIQQVQWAQQMQGDENS
ncbi:MAG: hypothetical protein A2Y38_04275 [Spirochaetes bacterium GWB1_59_5]|nr:MAG: hypothetical protein A2Y38_04275 [Spirochaetes bacterium GWB1_59_5]